MLNLPLALIGGVLGVYLSGGVLSVASIVGFITLFGIATRNGIMLVSHIRHLQEQEGVTDFRTAVIRGATERLVPILMTALAAGLALVPIALSAGRARQRDSSADGDGHHVRTPQFDGAEHDRRPNPLRTIRPSGRIEQPQHERRVALCLDVAKKGRLGLPPRERTTRDWLCRGSGCHRHDHPPSAGQSPRSPASLPAQAHAATSPPASQLNTERLVSSSKFSLCV